MITIGSAKIDTNVFLAPLSGVSDLSFRLIAREHGAKFCFYEMVDAHSLTHGSERKTLSILRTDARDKPIAAQILGNDPDITLRGARKMLDAVKVSFLDLNAACPAKKVVKKKAGSYLLADSRNLFAILKKLTTSLSVPVTVKLRIGYDNSDLKEISRIAAGCQSSGASAIFVHGRTRTQGYSGSVDHDSIKAVKDAVKVPVFASGNIFSALHAKSVLDKTGCDGLLVARGALGNPWIFGEIEEYLSSGKVPRPVDIAVRKAVLLRHLSYIQRYKDLTPSGKIGFMRKYVMWYMKGLPRAKRIREEVCVVKTFDEIIRLVESFETEEIMV